MGSAQTRCERCWLRCVLSMLQVGGEDVALKRVQLSIPAGHDLSGLTFVIRSADSTAWWRDGALQAHMHRTWMQLSEPCRGRVTAAFQC